MRLFNKKTALLLVPIIFYGIVSLSKSAQQAPDSNTKPAFNTSLPSDNFGSHELFSQMILMVLLVVALGFAVLYLSKKILPKLTKLSAKKIKVIETVNLGPRKSLHLLEIGNQLLLIGSTNENITKLADLTNEPLVNNLSAAQIDN